MEGLDRTVRRRTFRWPSAARDLVRAYVNSVEGKPFGAGSHAGLKTLITQVAALSGNPRAACWRFARQAGVKSKREYRAWTRKEQQKLLGLIAANSFEEVTVLMRRSATSVRSMLHRLGASARMGEDWFTKGGLAEALHIRADEVQKWIDCGWLRCRTVGANGLKRQLIDADDFCDFCKQHRLEIVGNRLNVDRLDFVQMFVFPPSHAELLPVRSAKKERTSYDEQMKKETGWNEEEDHRLSTSA